MAVYKSRRKDAAAQFVADARELRKATVRIARKFPASYKYVTTGPLLQLASEVYMNALKGNSIYVHKDMSERDYELRAPLSGGGHGQRRARCWARSPSAMSWWTTATTSSATRRSTSGRSRPGRHWQTMRCRACGV